MNKILVKLLVAFNITIWGLVGYQVTQAAEEKVVCIDKVGKDGKVLVGKDGKPQQDCKKIKVHKKLEGTKVPEKK
jgi:hypothetical protein